MCLHVARRARLCMCFIPVQNRTFISRDFSLVYPVFFFLVGNKVNFHRICKYLGFRRGVGEVPILVGHVVVLLGTWFSTFWGNVVVLC